MVTLALLAIYVPLADAVALVNGGVVAGVIAVSGEQDSYTFTANAGDNVQLRMADTGNTTLFPILTLYDPSGAEVASGTGSRVAAIDYTATTSGTYTVVAADNGPATGNYNLYLVRAPGANEGGLLPPGGTVAGVIDIGDLDSYTFTANVGEGIQLRVGDTGNTTLFPILTLYSPSGAEVASGTGSRVAAIDYTATTSGTYTVVVADNQSDGTGTYNLYLVRAPGANEGGALLNGGVKAGTIDIGDLDSYTFTATAGDNVQLRVTDTGNTALFPIITLYSPSGAEVASGTDSTVAAIDYTATTSGTYTVVVADNQSDGTGNYTVSFAGISRLNINDVTQVEGNSGTIPFTFTVTLSNPSATPVTVNYATANGTATAGSDYTAASGTVTFAPGQTSRTVTVGVTGEKLVEPNETFTVALSGAVGATIADGLGLGTITNDDSTALSIADASVVEGNSGTTNLVFTVTLSNPSATPVTVNYATANGTATAGSDYTAVPPTLLTFAPGQTSRTVTVVVTGDTLVEPNETLTVNLSGASGATIADGQGLGTILNDDGPLLRINDVSRAEGNSSTTAFVFTVSLTPSSASPVTVTAATANGSAVAPGDYTALVSTVLTFNPGETSKTVTVSVVGDTTVEPNETFTVNLSNAVGATIFDGQGLGTILNDDGPLLRINDVTQAEGNSGTTPFTFTVTLTPSSASPVTVTAAAVNGSAVAPGDYTALVPTVLTFNPGETSKTVTVPVLSDTTVEANETFSVTLSGAVGATIFDGQGLGTILNDDGSLLRINDVTQAEGHSGTTPFLFTVTLAPASATPVTVTVATADSGAVAPGDYTALAPTVLTFTPGETSKTVTVPVVGDTTVEANEIFFVNLSNAVGASLFDSQGLGTILNDDGPLLRINDVTQAEGPSGTTPFTFTVTLAPLSATPVTVTAATANGSASASGDYTALAPTVLTFAPGEGSKTVTVPVVGDTTVEPNETFTVNLSSAVGATIFDGQGLGTILNDDGSLLRINDVSRAEGHSGTTAFVFTVTLAPLSATPVTVTAATANGSASAPGDYTALALTVLTFAPGEGSKTVTVPVVGDTTVEANETFTVTLSSAVGATLFDSQGLGTILNDDGPLLRINDVTQAEGNSGTTAFAFTVTLTPASASPVTVTVATANGSAVAPGDYTALAPTVLTFTPGETSKTVTVPVVGDTTAEPNETFTVNLSSAAGATIFDSQGLGTILNDDGPLLRINDVTQAEGNSGTTPFTFTVTLVPASASPVTVTVATANSSAVAPGDYTALAPTVLTFTPGETNKTVTVPVVGDTTVEPNETFTVTLSSAAGATIFDGQGLGTILNDDGPLLRINDVTQAEGHSGTTPFTFTVTLAPASASPVTVTVATADSGAVAPGDYTALVPTVVTFTPGETSKTVTVPVVGDTTVEANEIFFVNLSNAVGASIFDSQGLGTILNDDGSLLRINDVSRAEGNSGTTAFAFAVTLAPVSANPVTVTVATANGSAVAPGDYTALTPTVLTFNPGEGSKTVTVSVVGDTTVEPNETFTVNLSGAVGATIFDSQGLGTILNDDGALLRINDVSRAEGNSGTTAFIFTVTLAPTSVTPVTVTAATANGSASAPADYTALVPTVLTFNPGEGSKTVTVPVVGDTTVEANETFVVTLSNAVGASIFDNQGLGTILNDDGPLLRINDVTQAEGHSGTTPFAFTVTVAPVSASPVTVTVATANGSAVAPGDYTALAPTVLTFPPGEGSKTVTVPVVGDTTVEANKTFTVNLSNAVGATLFDSQGVGTILNDDGPLLRINDVTQAEGHTFTTPFLFTVTLTPASASPVTVTVATANGSAVAPGDYGAIAPTVLTFSPGQTSQSVPVNVVGDTTVEANETFTVNLSGAVGATIFDGQGLGTILNDDTVGLTVASAKTAAVGASLTVTAREGGDVLLYPYWSTQEQETLLTIGSLAEDHAQRYVHVSLREGQSGRKVAGFTICLRAGDEWSAALRSQQSGQTGLYVEQAGSCDPAVQAAGLTPPPVSGHVLSMDADFGYVEAYILQSTASGAAVLWGEATLSTRQRGETMHYVATALVGFAAPAEAVTAAHTTAVAEALARTDGIDKEIMQAPWSVDRHSAVGTQVILTFPGGYQPGLEDPVSLYVSDAQEQERAVVPVTLPHVVNVCTLVRVQETLVVQCPTVEGKDNGAVLAGPLATLPSGQLRLIDTAEGQEGDNPDALPVRRFPVLGLVTVPGGMTWSAQRGAGGGVDAHGSSVPWQLLDGTQLTPGEHRQGGLPLTGE